MCGVWTSDAPAQEERKPTEAQALFDEGRSIMAEGGSLELACSKLEQSYELDKRGDTLLNLAECHRRQGKTASAWREFDEAIRYAKEVDFVEAMAAAEKLRDELAETLSELTVVVPLEPAPPEDLELMLDGKPLPKSQWREKLFVDPGVHSVRATAKGYHPYQASIDVKPGADRATITVALEPIVEPPQPKPKPPEPKPPAPVRADGTPLPVWAIVVGGSGVAMMGASIAFGVDTVSIGGELDERCGEERTRCPALSSYDFDGARQHELISFGLFSGFGVAGIVATTAGVVGLVVGLSAVSPEVSVLPWLSADGGGLVMGATLE